MSEQLFRFSPRPNRAHEIHWHDWDAEAFESAQREDKPILLSISAVWCHWCHVMDETSYSHENVIHQINERFIPIRIDNDKRPDINLRYNMGGWPTTAILTPNGEIIHGGTYIPPEQMESLLQQVIQYWDENKDDIKNQLLEPQAPMPNAEETVPENELITQIMDTVREQYDRAYGGIGFAPKFPQVDVWELALTHFTSTGDGWSAQMAIRTLDAMAGSGIFDPIEGGFFRYSTTREWTVPHFEKMLEDNALMAKLYLKAFQILGDETYQQVANAILSWANQKLLNPNGLWGGSQDADEEYYQLDEEERAKRPTPFVDPVVHTNWNAYMISAQLLGAALINPEQYASTALTALEALWDMMWSPGEGLYHYYTDEVAQLPGLFTDITAVAQALVDAYEYTGDDIYLERTHQLIEWADEHLRDETTYVDQPIQENALGRMRHPQKLLPENSLMARTLQRLALIEDRPEYTGRARQIIQAFSSVAKEQGIFAAAWALAADRLDAPEMTATVVESPQRHANDLRQAMFGVYDRNRIIRTWKVGTPSFQASGYPDLPMPALYICRGQACASPVSTPEEIINALQELAGASPEEI